MSRNVKLLLALMAGSAIGGYVVLAFFSMLGRLKPDLVTGKSFGLEQEQAIMMVPFSVAIIAIGAVIGGRIAASLVLAATGPDKLESEGEAALNYLKQRQFGGPASGPAGGPEKAETALETGKE